MAYSARALLSIHPKEQRVGFVLCHPSAFIHLCTIFALVSFNSPASFHILTCWPGTWARDATVLWMQKWDSLPATIKESYQAQSLAVSFLSVSAVARASHLHSLLNLATTTKIIVGMQLSLRLLLLQDLVGISQDSIMGREGGKWGWTIKQTIIITTTHTSCPWNPV